MKFLITTLAISIATIATQTMAQQPLQAVTPLSTVELNTIFNASQFENLQAIELSNQEMKDTQGAIAPLVAVGVLTASRFIVQRYVSQSAAVSIARQGGGAFLQTQTRQQAAQIAKAASQNPNLIRQELHMATPRTPIQFNHYHPSNSNAHIIYGSPRYYR